MDQCPVCTLYLREGMSLGAHLDTHPKDQVIRALCSIAKGSRRGTPYDSGRSEASFRSRSRTPARDSCRRRRSVRTSPAPSGSYRSLESAEGSPEARFDVDGFGVPRRTLEPARVVSTPSLHADSSYSESPAAGGPPPDPLERVYLVSRNSNEVDTSAGAFSHRPDYLFCGERSGSDSTESSAPVTFAQPRPSACTSTKLPVSKELEASPALRYVTANLNPVHFVLPASPSFVRGPTENIVVAVPPSDQSRLGSDHSAAFPRFAPISAVSFRRPGPAVTPVSQIVYQESAYINGKQFLSATPDRHETTLKPPIYRNVMVFNPFSGSSCLYPQQPTERRHASPSLVLDGSPRPIPDPLARSQTLPNAGDALSDDKSFSNDTIELKNDRVMPSTEDAPETSSLFASWGDAVDFEEASVKNSGVKILSNVKVELPVGGGGAESIASHGKSGAEIDADDATLPDFIDREICDSYDRSRFYRRDDFRPDGARHSGEVELSVANTFSVIKNIGNPNLYRDGASSSTQASDEPRPLPDLTCNEKPSVSPCSDLTNDSVEVAYDRPPRRLGPASARFTAVPSVTRNSARKNLFTKKPKKILRIKNKRDTKKTATDLSHSAEGNSDRAGVSSRRGPAEGFFKNTRTQKIRKTSVSSTVTAESSSGTDGNVFPSNASGDDSLNFVIDKLEPPGDEESECPSRFAPTPASGDDLLKAILEESSPSREETPDAEAIRPVNVIAFGNISTNDSDVGGSTKITPEPLFMEKHSDETGRDPYAEFFSVDRESFDTADGVQKIEVCIVEEEVTKDGEYVWDETPQKEEFTFANFMRDDYAQGIYGGPDGDGAGGPEGRRVPGQFSAEDVCGDDGDYAELLCPRDTFLERDRKGSFLETVGPGGPVDAETGSPGEGAALNIRTDERMPPRGELSEQDSSGDVDAPWAGMYHDVVGGSTSYDLIARETWPSDGSDVDMPISPAKHAFEAEDIPIVVGVKPPDKNYKCAACGKSFNCPKERRVHRSKEHPVVALPGDPVDVKKPLRKRRPPSVKTTVKIKSEKVVKNEGLSSLSNSKMDLTDEGVMNLKLVDGVLSPDLDAVDNKPKLELVKEEPKKRKRDYTCVTCKMEFFTDMSYHEHLKIHPLECLTCGKFFNRRANLQLHIKRHLGIKNFRCEVCDKRFITKQKMTEHHNIHVMCAPIKCNMCDDTFRRHSNMVQHRNRHHLRLKRRPRDHVCHCGEVFCSKKKLLWHKEVHDERPKACPHCSERFVHAASLTRHVRRAHNGCYVPDEKRKHENVQCPVCGNVYLKSSMDTHLRTHTGARPFSCVICSKGFSTKWNLKLHRWTHANRSSKPFKCALCKGAFVRRADYVSHMNAHRSVRPYTCNHCGCRFIRKYNCQRHVREHETAKRHACPVPDCGKTFHRGYYLSEHMRVHSGARPFSCNICGKASATKSNHNKHLKIHHAKEPVARED